MGRVTCALPATLVVLALWVTMASASSGGTRAEIERIVARGADGGAVARAAAVEQLAARGAAAVIPLFEMLGRGSEGQHQVIVEGLVAIGGDLVKRKARKRFVELQRRPTEDNAAERRALLSVVARVEGHDAISFVVAALYDDHVRATAADELKRYGPDAAPAVVAVAADQPVRTQEAVIEVLKTMPQAASPHIVPLFQKPSDRASRLARRLLTELKDPGVMPELKTLILERKAHDEGDVLRALAACDTPEAREVAVGMLESPFPYLRHAALEVMRGWMSPEAVDPVRDRLLEIARHDRSYEVQASAIHTLLAHWRTDASAQLLELAEDEDVRPFVREAAARVLGFLGPADIVEDLANLLPHVDRELGQAIAVGLRLLTYRHGVEDAADWKAPPPAAEALGERADPRPIDDLPPGVPGAWELGERGPVVLVLGGLPGLSPSTLLPWLGPLAATHRLIGVELPQPTTTVAEWEIEAVAALEAVRVALRLDRFSVVGHDLGGLVGLRFALGHPSLVERLVLVATPVPEGDAWRAVALDRVRDLTPEHHRDLEALRVARPDGHTRAAEYGTWRVLAPLFFVTPENAALVRDVPSLPDLGRPLQEGLGGFDHRAELEATSIPVYVILGAADPLPASQVDWFRGESDDPAARSVIVIDGARAFPQIEQPEAFRAALTTALPKP